VVHLEEIQDQVELALMREGHHAVARAYVLYREEQARKRAEARSAPAPRLRVRGTDGELRALDEAALRAAIAEACAGLPTTSAETLAGEVLRNLYDGVTEDEIATAGTMAARSLIETEPDYAKVAARLLLVSIRREALTFVLGGGAVGRSYAEYFPAAV